MSGITPGYAPDEYRRGRSDALRRCGQPDKGDDVITNTEFANYLDHQITKLGDDILWYKTHFPDCPWLMEVTSTERAILVKDRSGLNPPVRKSW